MRMIFLGTTELGLKICRHIVENKLAEVTTIVTLNQDFKISYSVDNVHNYTYADFSSVGKEFSIPVLKIEGKLSEHKEKLVELKPTVFLAVGWFHMIPKAIRDIAPLGAIGIHASLLPRYRGGAPLVWAMINGESKTGVSLFHLGDGVDNGDIIGQKEFSIGQNDTIREVINMAADKSLELVSTYVPLLSNNDCPRIRQNEAEATTFSQRSPQDGQIEWEWDVERIRNFIRAQTKPYPGAFTIIKDKKIVIWDANILPSIEKESAN